MRFQSLTTIAAAGLFATALGTANVAYGDVFKELIDGDFSIATNPGQGDACNALIAAVNAQTPHTIGGGGAVLLTQLGFSSVAMGDTHAGGDGSPGNTGPQSIEITETSNNNKKFDWVETTVQQDGFTLVLVRGKEQVAFVHTPDAVNGASYGDISSPLGIISDVLFCSLTDPTALPILPVNPVETCQISQDFYNLIYQQQPNGAGFNGPIVTKDQTTGEVSVCVPPTVTVSLCCTACTSDPNSTSGLPTCQLSNAGALGNNECDQSDPLANGDATDRAFCRQATDGSFLTPADTPTSFNLEEFQAPAGAGISVQSSTKCNTYEWNNQTYSYPTPCSN